MSYGGDAQSLLSIIKTLEKSDIGDIIGRRINEFVKMRGRSEDEWFSELCFCILTANSSARMGIKIQNNIGASGFLHMTKEELSNALKKLGYRFYNKRAEYIVGARIIYGKLHDNILEATDDNERRVFLVRNVRGIGYKEASHFLRNIGYLNYAIIDRHVLRMMEKYGLIDECPRTTLSPRKYLDYEKVLISLANKAGMAVGELDLYLWYMATGEVLK